jgi:hypothetical protein
MERRANLAAIPIQHQHRPISTNACPRPTAQALFDLRTILEETFIRAEREINPTRLQTLRGQWDMDWSLLEIAASRLDLMFQLVRDEMAPAKKSE